MKRNYVIYLSILCYCLFFLSCTKDEVNDSNPTLPTASNFFTFGKLGNAWTNNITTIGANDTIECKLAQKYNDIFEFQVVFSNAPDTVNTYWYISDTEFAFSNDSIGNDRQTLLKADSDVDSLYMYIDFPDTTIDKVVAKSVSITVPAGTFDCYKIMETQPHQPDTAYYFINKDAGIVKINRNTDNYIFKMLSKNF